MTETTQAYYEAERMIEAAIETQTDHLSFKFVDSDALATLPKKIAKHTKLRRIDLDGTQVIDLTPLSNLTLLSSLSLNATPVSDLNPLSHLKLLTGLSLVETRVSDLTPLSGLTNLARLDLSNTDVTNLTPISGLQLTTLMLNQTGIVDLTPLSGMTDLVELGLSNTGVMDLSPLSVLTCLVQLGLKNTSVTDLTPLSALHQLNDLNIEGSAATDLRPLLQLDRFVNDPVHIPGALQFIRSAACTKDPRIAQIATNKHKRNRAQTLFKYLKDLLPPEQSIPAASPAPLMVKIEDGRMRRTESGNLPVSDAMTRAEMGWAALKAYRDSFGASFSVHNYAPLPGVLSAFDAAMGEAFDPQKMISIGVMGTRIVNLSDDRRFLDNLPDGAGTDLRGFAAQISIFLNRFPDWVTYLEEAERDDATAEEVKAESETFEDLNAALSETGMVESDITDEFAFEIAIATGDNADSTAAKGLTASTREIMREMSEAAVREVKSGRIVRKDIEDMDQIANGEFAKLRFKAYGWSLVILKRKQDPLRRLANRFPARLGWLGPVLDYLIGADEDQ